MLFAVEERLAGRIVVEELMVAKYVRPPIEPGVESVVLVVALLAGAVACTRRLAVVAPLVVGPFAEELGSLASVLLQRGTLSSVAGLEPLMVAASGLDNLAVGMHTAVGVVEDLESIAEAAVGVVVVAVGEGLVPVDTLVVVDSFANPSPLAMRRPKPNQKRMSRRIFFPST